MRDLALSYAARYATTAAKLENYLIRKIRERGLEETDEPVDIPAQIGTIVDRLVELKYVDDEAYAKARSGSLLRRGYGKRRVNEALRHAGVDEHTREEVAPNIAKAREAAIILARKRRFGPYGQEQHQDDDEERARLDPAKRQKQIAAMLRAGHGFDTARAIIDAGSTAEVEEWLIEALDEAEVLAQEEHGEWHD
ncbi:MAG: regulatory protein RecX [Erythrobacter sp.]